MHIWWQQTTWVVLVSITSHIPGFINVAHTELWIFNFLLLANQSICKWGIKCVHLVMTDDMSSTCAHHYQHTKFHQYSPYRTLDIWLFLLLANQTRYANEVLNMHIRWWQTMWVVIVLVPPTTHIPSLTKIGHCILIRKWRFNLLMLTRSYISTCYTYIITSIQTAWQMKTCGPSSIAGGPQKNFAVPRPLASPIVTVCGWCNNWLWSHTYWG